MLSRLQGEFTRGGILDALSNRWQLYVLHCLKHQNRERVPLREVIDHVASWEYSKPIDQVTPQERTRVEEMLCQSQLPKLKEIGLITYDTHQRTVELAEAASKQDFYVGDLSERRAPWGAYYLLFAGISTMVLFGTWFDVYPFTIPPALADRRPLCGIVRSVSTRPSVRYYYQIRLRAREKPPGVE